MVSRSFSVLQTVAIIFHLTQLVNSHLKKQEIKKKDIFLLLIVRQLHFCKKIDKILYI